MKKELISIRSPLNSSPEIDTLINKHRSYSVSKPKIKSLKKVFVTYDGLVLKNGLLVEGCAFNLKGKDDVTLYYFFWRDTIEKYAVCKWGKSLFSTRLSGDQKYLLIHSKWFNYSFWINSFLPRLIQIENEGLLKEVKLIVPEGWKNIAYVWDSLKAFDVQLEMIPADHHLFVEHLIMPETRKWTFSFQPKIIQDTRVRMLAHALKITIPHEFTSKKIYLTRSIRGVRCAENEDEVLALVAKFGYIPVSFENLSIWEQIVLMNQTSHFVSIHGAGLSNLMFMQPNTSVLELINRPYAHAEYTFPFWKLANTLDLKYYMQLCDAINAKDAKLSLGKKKGGEDEKYLVNTNLIVDIELLELNLRLMEN